MEAARAFRREVFEAVGGWNEKANIEVVHTLCDILDELRPRADGASYRTQITFVRDRPGHG